MIRKENPDIISVIIRVVNFKFLKKLRSNLAGDRLLVLSGNEDELQEALDMLSEK